MRAQKLSAFGRLMETRHDNFHPDRIRAMGMIDVVFADSRAVREAWVSYFESLVNSAYNDMNGALSRLNKFNEMLTKMASELGSKHVGLGEITRVYSPQGAVDETNAQRKLRDELLRVLQASENLGATRRADGVVPIRPNGPGAELGL